MKFLRPIFILLVSCTLWSCGKYGKPFPPETLGALAPTDFQIIPLIDGVDFKWQASVKDRRGKDLKFFDGFKIYRITFPDQEKIEEFDFDEDHLLLTIPDHHFEKYMEMLEKAEEEGRPTRKVKLTEEELLYSFSDRDLEPGVEYGYFIVPFLYGDVRGEVRDVLVISFRGLQSTSYLYSLIDENDVNAEEIDIEAELATQQEENQQLSR